MKLVRIALSGKAGSGKTTLANQMCKAWADNGEALTWLYTKYSFADKLKELAIDLFGMNPDPAKKDRRLLQTLGTEALRKHVVDDSGHAWDDVWERYLNRQMTNEVIRLSGARAEGLLQVVDDMRFWNEFEALRNEGFMMVRLEVERVLRAERLGLTQEQLAEVEMHPSERDLDERTDWDMVLIAEGSIEEHALLAQMALRAAMDKEEEEE